MGLLSSRTDTVYEFKMFDYEEYRAGRWSWESEEVVLYGYGLYY